MAANAAAQLQSTKGWNLPARVVRVLGDPRFCVEGPVLALHPLFDGTTWTVEEPGTLRRWNTLDGRELHRYELSDLETLWAFGGDAPQLASASDDLSFYNCNTGESTHTIRQPSWITALAFRLDGGMLATGHDDGRVRLWDVATAKMTREWTSDKKAVSTLAFSRDGRQLAAGREDRSISLFDVVHGVAIGKLTGHTDRISRITWHPSNQYLATSSWDTTARLWDIQKGEQIFILNGQADQVHAAVFSPDGTILASVDSASVIWLWDPFQGKVLKQLRGHVGEVTVLAFTPDGQHLLSGGGDGRLILWNVASGANVLNSIGDTTYTSRIKLSPQEDHVAAILGGSSIFVWDTSQGNRVGTIAPLPSHATSIVFRSQDKRLASGHDDGRVLNWNTTDYQKEQENHEHTSRVTSMAVDALGQHFATGGSVDGYVYLWSNNSADPVMLIPGATEGCTVETIAFIPHNTLLAVAGIDWRSSGQEGCLCLWNYAQPAKVASVPVGSMAIAARSDGKQLAVATLSESICLYELPSLTLEKELVGHMGLVMSLAYTQDGKSLLSSGDDGTVRVWDVQTGKEKQVLDTDVSVRDMAVSKDGRFVYTANANATAFVIDLKRNS